MLRKKQSYERIHVAYYLYNFLKYLKNSTEYFYGYKQRSIKMCMGNDKQLGRGRDVGGEGINAMVKEHFLKIFSDFDLFG